MQENIYITGIGIISATGNNVLENLESLRNGKSGISDIKLLNTKHKNDFKAGEVKLSDSDMLDLLQIPAKDYIHYSRTSLLAMIAAKETLKNAQLEDPGENTGIVSATTVGGMDKTEKEFPLKNYDSGFIQTHSSGDSTQKTAEYLKISGYRTSLTTACSSAANSVMHGAKLIKHGFLDKVLVGGTDALCKFTLNGFNSLMILDKNHCKPFDKDRQGLNLGEGAAFLLLESESSLNKRKIKPFCKLTGYANANDAYHQTASSPEGEGAYSAMSGALKMSGIKSSEINYINAHGTGTHNNDLSEGIAIKRIFGNKIPHFSSTKSFTGHTLGAAAAVEAVFAVLAIKYNLIFPNLNFKNEIEELKISPVKEIITSLEVNNVLSNSFGFGGNNSSIIFAKV